MRSGDECADIRHDGGVATATPNATAPEGAIRALVAGRAPSLRSALLFGVFAGAIVVGLRAWLEWVGPMPGDQWARYHQNSALLQPTPMLDLGTFFSVIGTPVVAALTVLVATIYAARAEGVAGVAFTVLSAGGVLVNAVLKELSGPTPLMLAINGAGAELNYPSGHTVYAVTSFGAMAVLARRARRTDVVVPLVILIALMGPFRVFATAHFVSDVVAGYLVGLAWLALAAALTLAARPPARSSR